MKFALAHTNHIWNDCAMILVFPATLLLVPLLSMHAPFQNIQTLDWYRVRVSTVMTADSVLNNFPAKPDHIATATTTEPKTAASHALPITVTNPPIIVRDAPMAETSSIDSATSENVKAEPEIPNVPFYSQFRDIASSEWQKVGCGITDLAMIIDFYKPDAPTVEELLAEGIAEGAYEADAGWTYQGLIDVSRQYGLSGYYYDMKGESDATAMKRLRADLAEGPIIASVYYKLEPGNPIPHLIVVSSIEGDIVYYNDPATKGPAQTSTKRFLAAWKKRVVVIRPAGESLSFAVTAIPQSL